MPAVGGACLLVEQQKTESLPHASQACGNQGRINLKNAVPVAPDI